MFTTKQTTQSAGFSLLEMLMMLVIVGMLSVFALPTLSTWRSNQQRDSAVSRLYADMQFARTTALQFQKTVTVCRSNQITAKTPNCTKGADSGGWELGWLVFYDRGELGVFEAGDVVLRKQNSTSKLTLRGNNNIKNRVTFFEDGMSQSTAGTFAACDSRGWDDGKLLVVSTTGRLRTQNTNDVGDLNITDCMI